MYSNSVSKTYLFSLVWFLDISPFVGFVTLTYTECDEEKDNLIKIQMFHSNWN